MNATATRVKALNPRSPDTKFMGHEPTWTVQPSTESRVGAVSLAFAWYNYFYNKYSKLRLYDYYIKQLKQLVIIKCVCLVSFVIQITFFLRTWPSSHCHGSCQ